MGSKNLLQYLNKLINKISSNINKPKKIPFQLMKRLFYEKLINEY